ncbi:MAG: hypothetical protein ACREHG_00565 [Candidatus Saccharimonadales bacterium]
MFTRDNPHSARLRIRVGATLCVIAGAGAVVAGLVGAGPASSSPSPAPAAWVVAVSSSPPPGAPSPRLSAPGTAVGPPPAPGPVAPTHILTMTVLRGGKWYTLDVKPTVRDTDIKGHIHEVVHISLPTVEAALQAAGAPAH